MLCMASVEFPPYLLLHQDSARDPYLSYPLYTTVHSGLSGGWVGPLMLYCKRAGKGCVECHEETIRNHV